MSVHEGATREESVVFASSRSRSSVASDSSGSRCARRRTVIRHQRVVRLYLIRALHQRRELARRLRRHRPRHARVRRAVRCV
jgi:hypothetical protein